MPRSRGSGRPCRRRNRAGGLPPARERAAHLHLGVVDGRVEQAALALLRIERRGEIEPRRRDLDVLARPVAGLIRDDERRAVEALLRPPVAGELLPHAVLPRLALLDQAGDEQVRQDGGDRDARQSARSCGTRARCSRRRRGRRGVRSGFRPRTERIAGRVSHRVSSAGESSFRRDQRRQAAEAALAACGNRRSRRAGARRRSRARRCRRSTAPHRRIPTAGNPRAASRRRCGSAGRRRGRRPALATRAAGRTPRAAVNHPRARRRRRSRSRRAPSSRARH